MAILSTPKKEKPTKGEQAGVGFQTTFNAQILIDLTASVKAILLAGRDIRSIDFPQEERQFVMGIIAALRDELPIKQGWVTIRESHLSETRLRARRYRIDGAYLPVEGNGHG